MTPPKKPASHDRLLEIHFNESDPLLALAGAGGDHLRLIEKALNIEISQVGNILNILGTGRSTKLAQETIDILRERLENDMEITKPDIEAAIRIAAADGDETSKERAKAMFSDRSSKGKIVTKRKHITPRSPKQGDYLSTIDKYALSFGVGPAGTGKTYLAVAKGVEYLLNGDVERLIVTRPAVEAGEELGFLPGDMQEKIDPYLRPVYDALYDMFPQEQVIRMMAQGQIEVAPLAFMRGRTLSNAFIVLDEAQNTTSIQMKMFLTRLGENGKMVICGDMTQTDLPERATSGLMEAVSLLRDDEAVGLTEFTVEDVVRHPLVARIISAYERRNRS